MLKNTNSPYFFNIFRHSPYITCFFFFFSDFGAAVVLLICVLIYFPSKVTFKFFIAMKSSMVVCSRIALTPGVYLLFRNTALKIMEIFMEVDSILSLSPFAPTEFQCKEQILYAVT